MKKTRLVFAITLSLTAFGGASAFSTASLPASAAPAQTPDAVSHHRLTINGHVYAYTARAGTITLRNDKDQPTLRMFYTADTLDGTASSRRPVTFFYNGGPGSATLWLRMGSFGPRRVVVADAAPTSPAPFHIVDNQYSLLDKTDLVFIDAPGTGFGRIIGVGKPTDFFGADPDIDAFAHFITRYITTFHRWNSPKFLFGESYGTTRSALLVDHLQSEGVAINGVVLLSSIINYGLMSYGAASGDWQSVLYLPSLATSAWYHHAAPYRPASIAALAAEVERFASTDYLLALEKGAELSPADFETIVAKLHQYTGLSPEYIRNSNLRIPYSRFSTELLRNSGKIIGRYDARYETDTLDRAGQRPAWDAVDALIDAPLITANNVYLLDELHYNTEQPYRTDIGDYEWDGKHNGRAEVNAAPALARALTQNPHLHVFSANGYYDFATPFYSTVYTLNHLNLDPGLQNHISFGFYESGHMVYFHLPALIQFKSDLANWYDRTLSQR